MSDRDYSKSAQPNLPTHLDDSLDVDEIHMRETLGLSGRGRSMVRQPAASPASKPRHRFVQDGEIPVIHLSIPRDGEPSSTSRSRIATLEAALETEQAARARAEQAVQAGIAQIHALETKLAHVEMASREAIDTERKAREASEAALQRAVIAHDAALRDGLVARPAAAAPHVDAHAKPVRMAKPKIARVLKAPRVPKAPRVKEPKPVKWWLGKSAKG